MKIQCDVCSREEASVFCSADEAALCDGCDRRVHHANKLASKHHRFSLLHPSYKEAPRCDICQERRALIFCREDRAILCRECDLPIHTANPLAQKHSRFLLTGIKLSGTSAALAADSSQQAMNDNNKKKKKKPPSSAETGSSLPAEKTATASTEDSKSENLYTSSISEYLIETLPGWHVEDLLGSSALAEKVIEGEAGLDSDLDLVSEDLGLWAPRAPQVHGSLHPALALDLQDGVGFKDSKEGFGQWWNDDGFTVPQISPPYKRSRPVSLWQIG